MQKRLMKAVDPDQMADETLDEILEVHITMLGCE